MLAGVMALTSAISTVPISAGAAMRKDDSQSAFYALEGSAQIEEEENSWTLENDVLRLQVEMEDGSIRMTSFFNKAAEKEYLSRDDANNYLFSYQWEPYEQEETMKMKVEEPFSAVSVTSMASASAFVTASASDAQKKQAGLSASASNAQEKRAGLVASMSNALFKSSSKQTVRSDDGGWQLGETAIEEITTKDFEETEISLGKSIQIPLTNEAAGMQVTVLFEIYDGVAGARYQTFIKNLRDEKMVIRESDVISLNFPNQPHYLHYVNSKSSSSGGAENATWKVTEGSLHFDNVAGSSKNNGRNALCVYKNEGHGWWIMPETNWCTQVGNYTNKTNSVPEFASASCWDNDSKVKISTHPEALMLTLQPDEEFPYIGVDMTAFQGDVVDGKMAVEEHFQKRYRYHDTSTILNTNDWDYNSKSNYAYFRDVIIPKALGADVEMVMIDDLWNVNRDSIEAVSKFRSLEELSSLVKENGLMFGVWFSLTGGGHNAGRDLANPVELSEKMDQIETMLNEYGMNHQMIDLTEFWQTTEETEYSSPCDSVYRKNTMVNRALNELVDRYPGYLVKLTNEVDVFPTQGNRNCGLLHIANNGWVVHNAGFDTGMKVGANAFGYMPLSSLYATGRVSGDVSEYYHYLFARNVKLNEDPSGDKWTGQGIEVLAAMNRWRHGDRVKALTDEVKRPVYLGEGWNKNEGSTYGLDGPYGWMYTSPSKDRALLIGTSFMNRTTSRKKAFTADMRWLDASMTYMVADVTLDHTGEFQYAYKGTYSGEELQKNGFLVDLTENTDGAKAFWFEAVKDDSMQVIYADENVASYESYVESGADEDILCIHVSGSAGKTVSLVVGDAKNNRGREISIMLDEAGEASVRIPASKMIAPTEAEALAKVVRIEFEEYADGRMPIEKSNPNITFGKMGDAATVGASGNDYRSIVFENEGEYVTCKFDVEKAGEYIVKVAYKANEKDCKTAIGREGTIVSTDVDMSDGKAYPVNKFFTQECRMIFEEGENGIDIICRGKGSNKSSNLSARVDYIEIEPVFKSEPVLVEAEELAEEMACSQKEALQLVEDANASGGQYVQFQAEAGSAYLCIPVTVDYAGQYDITLRMRTSELGAFVQAQIDGKNVGSLFDFYRAESDSAQFTEISLENVEFQKAGTKEIVLLAAGRNVKNVSGYEMSLDCITISAKPGITALENGIVMNEGEEFDLNDYITVTHMQDAYQTPDSIRYTVKSESIFNVVDICEDGIGKACNPGTAVVRAVNKYAPEFGVDFIVTVVPDGTEKAVWDVMEGINLLGSPYASVSYGEELSRAEAAFAALTPQQKNAVSNSFLLKSWRTQYDEQMGQETGGDNTISAISYLEDLEYLVSRGTINRKVCPSGSHKLQFTQDENAVVYEHGIGFEPPSSRDGVLLVQIPAGMDHFYAKVGLDYAMSLKDGEYDKENRMTFSIDGQKVAETGKIISNYKNGVWTDNSYEISFAIPEGSKWMLIEQDAGKNQTCDHVLLADARFENERAADVVRLIASISPGVDISAWKEETAEKICAAEEAYYQLTETERALVSNHGLLVTYRDTHSRFGLPLLETEDTEGYEAVNAVNVYMVQIPTAADVTAGHRGLVHKAWNSYQQLSDNLKNYVCNIDAMYEAMWKLETLPFVPADKSALNEALEKADAVDVSLYTEESYERLQRAVEAARAVMEDEFATSAEVSEQVENLEQAIMEMQSKPSEPEDPEEPSKPSEPEEPEEPSKPSEPEEPEEPSKPSEPEEPEEPSKPSKPENPTVSGASDEDDSKDDTSTPLSGRKTELENSGRWILDEEGWWYQWSDGTYPKSCWQHLEYAGTWEWYHFDEQGYMQTGWFTDKDSYIYYLHTIADGTRGHMYTGWHQIDGKWYYFNPYSDGWKGALVVNSKTPDGYYVDKDGVWIQ